MLCDAHHLEVPEVRDVMGRPQRWVLTADLTCMSKYQLREWQRLMFLSITCFWSIYSLKKSLIPEISPGGPQRGGTGRDGAGRKKKHFLEAYFTCLSKNQLKNLRCSAMPIIWGSPRSGTWWDVQRGGTGRDRAGQKKNTSLKLILHVWAKISWKICDALWYIFLKKFWGKL